jgi:hypothetical protein
MEVLSPPMQNSLGSGVGAPGSRTLEELLRLSQSNSDSETKSKNTYLYRDQTLFGLGQNGQKSGPQKPGQGWGGGKGGGFEG